MYNQSPTHLLLSELARQSQILLMANYKTRQVVNHCNLYIITEPNDGMQHCIFLIIVILCCVISVLRVVGYATVSRADAGPCIFKAAPWDDINFRFYFCNEVVYPPDRDFIFFRVFRLKKIFVSTFL